MANFDDLLSNTPAGEQGAPQYSKEEYAAKKKAEREAIFELSDKTAMEVAGDSGKFKQYLDVLAVNDRYTAVNALLILAQKPETTRLGTFDHWKERNCSVKPNQTAISILVRQEYTKDDGTPGAGYDVRKVFDISQVDTRRLRSSPTPNFTERQILSALISKCPMQITGVDELPDNLGAKTEADGSIYVRKGMEFSDTFRAVAYELASAEVKTDSEMSTEQEFCAYSAAYMLCKKYGADTQKFSFESAPGMLEGMEAREVKGQLGQIHDTYKDISGRMERQLEAAQKAAKSTEAR